MTYASGSLAVRAKNAPHLGVALARGFWSWGGGGAVNHVGNGRINERKKKELWYAELVWVSFRKGIYRVMM